MEMQTNQMQEQQTAAAPELETGVSTADAGQVQEVQPGTGAARMSWKDIMADSEYRKEYDAAVQSIVQKRLKGRAQAEEKLGRLAPVLEAISKRYAGGGTLDEADTEELAGKILAGESRARRERAREHLEELYRQEQAMREKYPDFNFAEAMEDERFIKLTAPHTGLSLEDAYCAMHYAEIREQEARNSLQAVTRSVQAGRERPAEISGRQSASRSSADPRTMSREQREALKKRIYEAKAQGKKLPYGG